MADGQDEYFLGYRRAEQERLKAQAQQLGDEARWLFDQIDLAPGAKVVEIGCGPSGCLEILSTCVGPSGSVTGVERSQEAVDMACQMARDLGLENVEVRCGDARSTGLPHGAFDLATARLVLVNVPKPEQIVAEAVALVRPGGWVAFHEADWIAHVCDPPSEAWTAIVQLLVRYTEKNGIDLFVGRKVVNLLRSAGLTDIRVKPLIHVYPPGAPRRNILLDFSENLSERILADGLVEKPELDRLKQALKHDLDDPDRLVISHLFLQAWVASPRKRDARPVESGAMTEMIDIKAFIDDRPIAPFLWALVAMCFLIVVADGMDVAIMGFVTPSILQDWHISRPAFGLVISAAPFGLVIGALIAGPSSDRFGRKIVLTSSVLLFGIFTVMTAAASSPQEMALLRLLAGMGMGAAMPNATTLLSEYVSQRRRSLLITIMFSGFTLGSAAIGFIAGYLIPHFGWRSVLLVGGITPLLLVPFLVAFLPELARYLALQGAPAEKIAAMLGRVTGASFTGGETFVSPEPVVGTKTPIGVLFSDGYAATTIALWITYFMGLMVVYLLTGWLPTLMKDAGLTITAAANVTAMFQIGATVGGILIGWSMDLRHPSRVIGAAYLAGAVFIMGLAWAGALSGWLATLVFAAGFCVSGAQIGLSAFAPGCYPTVARATGVSWMLGIGRFGSIAGSLVGGALLGLGWGFGAILGILAIPALCAAIAIASTRPVAGRFPRQAAA